MTRLWPEGEVVQVQLNGRHQPAWFAWQERIHRICQVQQRWQVDSDWWGDAGHVRRDYLAVTTTDGLLCVLYYDYLHPGWYLAKVYD